MNLVNKKVTHQVFGEGEIYKQSEHVIEVAFSHENKKFLYPQAFSEYLTLHDEKYAGQLQLIINTLEAEKNELLIQQEENRLLQREKQKLRMEYDRITNSHKLHQESQFVYWCTEEEAEKALTEWNVFTGITKTGANKGKPNKAIRLHRNSAVVITERKDDSNESERKILGVFMVAEKFVGKLCTDGKVRSHELYKLSLTAQESVQIPFWNYYENNKTPGKMTWNSGKYRYFTNEWMAQILIDIVKIKKGTEDEQLSQQFLNYFCKMNQLTLHEIQQPNGALLSN